jgi:hypothetical protein
MEDIEDGRWLTLAEVAAARHISTASAARLVRRHEQWRRQRDNQGYVRVLVPTEALTADVREEVLEDVRQQDSESVMAAVAGLIARAERAEIEADRHREHADAAEARVAQAEARADQAHQRAVRAEAALQGERSRADGFRSQLDTTRAELQTAKGDAADLRRADEARKAKGRWARLRAAWRRE